RQEMGILPFAEGVALMIGLFAERRGPQEVGRRFAVAEVHGGVLWSKECRVALGESAIALGRDVDVSRQGSIGRPEQFGADGSEMRILLRRLLAPASLDDVAALAVIVFRRVQAANAGESVHLV